MSNTSDRVHVPVPPQYQRAGKFRGAGGLMGGHQPKAPSEAADNLRSTQYALILDMLSEGPIEGLCDSNWNVLVGGQNEGAAVWFNQAPLANDPNSGARNFNGVNVQEQFGYGFQLPIPGFYGAQDTVNVGVNLLSYVPFVFSVDDPNTTRVSVAIRVPQLMYEDNKGNIYAYSVNFEFGVDLNDQGFWSFGLFTISGKCTSDYVREYMITLPKSDKPWNDHWSISVVRRSSDDGDAKHFSAIICDYYTRLIDYTFFYPYCAQVATQIDAEQLSDIPTRSYRIKGLLVQVPVNYFPERRSYTRNMWTGADTGVYQPWTGQFYSAWSNNPAWCFYDMATNTRYGAGEFLAGNIDKWALYQIALYCDEPVPDGFGGWEPRFTCNTYIQSQQQAWKVLSDLASVFRGMLYWGQGQMVPVADMPKPIMHSFTNANVVDARFTYADSELKNRFSDATITWNDPQDFFQQKIQSAFDIDQRIKYGYRETKFTSFACSSRGQARRHGLYSLATNKYETETVTFQTGFEAMYLRPGDIIGIVNNDRIGLRQGGRVKYVQTHYVTVDQPIAPFPDGQEIFFYSAHDVAAIGDAFADSNAAVQERPPMMWMGYIYGMNGLASDTFYVQDAQGNAPPVGLTYGTYIGVQPGTIFVIGANVNTPLEVPQETYRILTISEKEKQLYEISAVTYEEGKYDLVDFGVQFVVPRYTRIPSITFVLPPNNLTATLQIVNTNNVMTVTIVLNWEQPPEANLRSYKIRVLPPGSGWMNEDETSATTYYYIALVSGLYTFQVSSVNHANICSQPATVSITVPDLSLLKPHRISGLELQLQGNSTTYVGTDPILDWRLNSPTKRYEINSEEPYGANVGDYDPYFVNFEVIIYDGNTHATGWTDHVTNLQYTINYAKNKAAWGDGKPRHKLLVSVQALNDYGIEYPPFELLIDNPPPDPPTDLKATVAGGPAPQIVTIQWVRSASLDTEQYWIYQSATNDFTKAVKQAEQTALATSWHSAPEPSGSYWYFVTGVDSFGSESQPTAGVQATIP